MRSLGVQLYSSHSEERRGILCKCCLSILLWSEHNKIVLSQSTYDTINYRNSQDLFKLIPLRIWIHDVEHLSRMIEVFLIYHPNRSQSSKMYKVFFSASHHFLCSAYLSLQFPFGKMSSSLFFFLLFFCFGFLNLTLGSTILKSTLLLSQFWSGLGFPIFSWLFLAL